MLLARLVPAASLAAAESASVSAETSASLPIAFLAVYSAVGAVVALGRLERQFFDVHAALSALEAEIGNIVHLPLRAILIVHFRFA